MSENLKNSPYRLAANEGFKAIKRFLSYKKKEKDNRREVKRNSKQTVHFWCNRLIESLSRIEGKTIKFIKHNRTRVLLDFFRKNSGALVVVLVAVLVIVGNINFDKGKQGGFLFGYFERSVDNKEKIKKRVKSQSQKVNLTMAPLALADSSGDEDISDLIIKDGNLNQNQMQQQVLTSTTPPDAKKLLSDGADVAVYEVQSGDTVSTIANDFKITTNTILWANDIDDPDMIQPGDKIFILPVTGVEHVVKEGDTIKKIAKKYEAGEDKIIAFNELPADGSVEVGDELIIPDGEKEDPRPVIEERSYYSSDIADSSGSRGPSIIDRNPKGGHSFPYGYCTWYVASKKYVPWGGNAGTWLYHAKAYGAKTGKTPKKGAILVTSESWYGHVAVVEKVKGSSITISEMNYKGFGVVSSRTLSVKSGVIKGYIY